MGLLFSKELSLPIKLTKNRVFIPSLMVDTDDGRFNNRDLENDAIKCKITLASIEETSFYLETQHFTNSNTGIVETVSHSRYDDCVKKHCLNISGLVDENENPIATGKALVNYPTNSVTRDLIREIFNKVIGIHKDDLEKSATDIREKAERDALSVGESPASE